MCKMRGLVITTLAGFMATSIYAQIQITPEVGTSIYKEGRIKVEGKATISPRIGVGVDYFFNQQKNGWGLMSGLYFYQKKDDYTLVWSTYQDGKGENYVFPTGLYNERKPTDDMTSICAVIICNFQ